MTPSWQHYDNIWAEPEEKSLSLQLWKVFLWLGVCGGQFDYSVIPGLFFWESEYECCYRPWTRPGAWQYLYGNINFSVPFPNNIANLCGLFLNSGPKLDHFLKICQTIQRKLIEQQSSREWGLFIKLSSRNPSLTPGQPHTVHLSNKR